MTEGESHTYTLIYRNGIIEAVEGAGLSHEHEGGRRIIPSVWYEQILMQYLPKCFQWLQQMRINPPVVVALTLTGTRGLEMSHDAFWGEGYHAIDRDSLLLPEAWVEDLNATPGPILKPMFDLVWNACGKPHSLNFDQNGNWVTRR